MAVIEIIGGSSSRDHALLTDPREAGFGDGSDVSESVPELQPRANVQAKMKIVHPT